VYDTPEELLREIQAGEDSLIDWKEVVFQGGRMRFVPDRGGAERELAKDLSCFANTEGGVIVFGVRRDKERIGIPPEHMEQLQQFIAHVAQNNLEPPLAHLLIFDHKMIPNSAGDPKLCLKLEIRKAQYSVHAPLGDRPYHRVGDHCFPVSMDYLPRLLERRGLIIPFEERPVFSAMIDDVERARFELYHRRRYGYDLTESPTPMERLLKNLKLAIEDEGGKLRPTALGLLLFSSTPDRFITGAYVDVTAYRGPNPDAARQLDSKQIRGPVPEQIERTLEYLKTSPLVPVPATKDGAGRLDQPAYSLRALQEAVVNALVHRDYGISGSQVRVFLFEDRIEVSNPGRLHNTLSPEDLFAGCQPVRRNQMLAGFLREYQSPITGRAYMELRGEGFLAMVRECERVSGKKPELVVVGDSVKVTIYAGPVPHEARADA
jgi:predicted HTH transcriptional regulator